MITAAQKATRAQTKSHNKTLILKTIYEHGQISRADVARNTHLTRPTVSTTVTELMEEGLVTEVGLGPSEGGKPPILLSVIDDSRHLIGIDLANSEFRGAVFNLRGHIIQRHSIPVNERDGAAALQLVYDLLDVLTPAATSPILGIGIGTPGLMNPEDGLVHKAVNLNWLDLPLRDLLVSRYDLPVYIANDSQIAALGEYTFGRDYPVSSMVVVKVGVGIGSGIIINQHLHYGDSYSAGEIGHIQMVPDGLPCRCGNRGCLETVASTQTLLREARQMMRANPYSALHRFAESPETLTTEAVLQAFEAGDEELRQVLASMGCYLGVALANLVGILNINKIVIGGSLARFGDGLIEPAREEMRRRVQSLLPEETSVEVARLGTDIVIYGAAALLLTQELGLG